MTLTPTAPAVRTTDELREIATIAGPDLELAPAETILEWAVETFGDKFCITSSMADAVLAHLASQVSPGIDVVFLDTGYHFIETIGTRDAVAATMPVNVVTLSPTISVREQDEQYGKDLFARDPDLCCKLRKVQPLTEGLASYDAWATGLRREETHNRVIAPVVGWDEGKQKVKVSPLAKGDKVKAVTYQGTRVDKDHVPPTQLYMDLLIQGAYSHGLSMMWIAYLQSFTTQAARTPKPKG